MLRSWILPAVVAGLLIPALVRADDPVARHDGRIRIAPQGLSHRLVGPGIEGQGDFAVGGDPPRGNPLAEGVYLFLKFGRIHESKVPFGFPIGKGDRPCGDGGHGGHREERSF